ncbi:hypothetical protein J5N97_013045 [Dioscorea zingiberensis]|uniref:Uncharacterized protein n=1 Tax=Dioscorea zingiberensis TaxID=325984 RepID=A0A9D5CQ05_9LILI|nr:hypothetical protein J5N97_013045 [Dioscorea zingiberensis]
MVELSLMASAAFSPGNFHQEQSLLCRAAPKDCRALLPGFDKREELLKSSSLHFNGIHQQDQWKSLGKSLEYDHPAGSSSTVEKTVLIDVQDSRPDSVLFSFGIAEQCTRHEKILQFLMSGSNVVEGDGLNISLLSELMGLQTLAIGLPSQPLFPGEDEFCLYDFSLNGCQAAITPEKQLYCPELLLDFVGDMSHNSKIMVHPDGRVLFMGTGAEMKDLLSIVAEFYLPKNRIHGTKQSMLVPYFRRWGKNTKAHNHGLSSVQTQDVAPQKSPEAVKLKSLQKKQRSRKAGNERNFYGKNYFSACESLLTFIAEEKRSKTAVHLLKKSGPEITQFLTKLSAGIAGTGLAVLFSVIYKVANGWVPFCTTNVLNTGFGFSLVWLSWAVNRLRDTIINISKNSSRLSLNDDITQKVEQSMEEVFFRALAVMAVVVLRFA